MRVKSLSRRGWGRAVMVLGAASACSGLWQVASAQTAGNRSYAVMSLVGDAITTVGFEGTTGSHLTRNSEERTALDNDMFDRLVLTRAKSLIEQAAPGAPVMPIKVNEARYYEGQRDWLDVDRARLPAEITDALREAKVTHLVLVTKHRAPARVQMAEKTVGTGRFEGLGFYIDRVMPVKSTTTGDQSIGFLAPFAFVRISLVPLAPDAVVTYKNIETSEGVVAGNRPTGGDPWEILSNDQKFQSLGNMLSEGLDAALPKLLKGEG